MLMQGEVALRTSDYPIDTISLLSELYCRIKVNTWQKCLLSTSTSENSSHLDRQEQVCSL